MNFHPYPHRQHPRDRLPNGPSSNSTSLQAPNPGLPRDFKIPGTNLKLGYYQSFGHLRAPRETLKVIYKAQRVLHQKIQNLSPNMPMEFEEWVSGPEKLELGPYFPQRPDRLTLQEGLSVLHALMDMEKDNPVYGCFYDVYRAGMVVGAVKLWEGYYEGSESMWISLNDSEVGEGQHIRMLTLS